MEDRSTVVSVELTDNLRQPRHFRIGGLQCNRRIAKRLGKAESEALKAGANDFLSKDFQIEQFYCRVVQSINMVHFVRELHDMANRDYLTRLHNRRYLFQVMESLHAEAVAGKRILAVAMVDADRFKRINDEYGFWHGSLLFLPV